MLCKQQNRDPGHCLKEGRRVTRCATDLYVLGRFRCLSQAAHRILNDRITKMRENCLQQFDTHWQCLENNNQVKTSEFTRIPFHSDSAFLGILHVSKA